MNWKHFVDNHLGWLLVVFLLTSMISSMIIFSPFSDIDIKKIALYGYGSSQTSLLTPAGIYLIALYSITLFLMIVSIKEQIKEKKNEQIT